MYLGIDLGTQSVKALLVDADGNTVRSAGEAYPIHRPQPGYAEQHPAEWWAATVKVVQAVTRYQADAISGIGVVGQMHGLVLLDGRGEVVRPAIIWMDQRSTPQVDYHLRRDWHRFTRNHLATGMAAASILWLKDAEPQSLAKTATMLAPKDWIRYKLCGELNAEPGDASGLLLLDLDTRLWSSEILKLLGLTNKLLPTLVSSTQVVGTLTQTAADELGLRGEIPVVAGSSDQAGMLTGSGVIHPGQAALTVGTGGQLSVVSAKPAGNIWLNTFCHAEPGTWYVMGAILAAGYALTWWQSILKQPLDRMLRAAADVPPGSENLKFGPNLNGERVPGGLGKFGVFSGLTGRHEAGHMSRAVLEGVAYALRECQQNLRRVDVNPQHIVFGGGAARGELWGQIIASVLDMPLTLLQGEEQTALGAAMLAAVGTGHFANLSDGVAAWVKVEDVIDPVADWVGIYNPDVTNR